MTVTAFSYLKLIRPIGKLLTGSVHTEHLTSFEHGTGAAGLQLLIRLTHAAAARRSKRNDCLASEILALQKAIDDRGCYIPPDWESNVDRIVFSYVVTERFDLRA